MYEASGSLVAATWLKAPVVLPPGTSYDEYLAMQLPADEVEEVRPGPALAAAPRSQGWPARALLLLLRTAGCLAASGPHC